MAAMWRRSGAGPGARGTVRGEAIPWPVLPGADPDRVDMQGEFERVAEEVADQLMHQPLVVLRLPRPR
jgi:hypothetical protein